MSLPKPYGRVIHKFCELDANYEVLDAYFDWSEGGQKIREFGDLRAYLGLTENDSVADAYIKLKRGSKIEHIIIESKNTIHHQEEIAAVNQLKRTAKDLFRKKKITITAAVVTGLRLGRHLTTKTFPDLSPHPLLVGKPREKLIKVKAGENEVPVRKI